MFSHHQAEACSSSHTSWQLRNNFHDVYGLLSRCGIQYQLGFQNKTESLRGRVKRRAERKGSVAQDIHRPIHPFTSSHSFFIHTF
ncbi:uncharacterized protein IAS62_004220 [Cryptococcus decagattii]|uniref:Uncharacterized protein n=1 Tax=Cryptococcus decagattii TaxID=1859122 RepID=A0ABZ2AZL6_9TREE